MDMEKHETGRLSPTETMGPPLDAPNSPTTTISAVDTATIFSFGSLTSDDPLLNNYKLPSFPGSDIPDTSMSSDDQLTPYTHKDVVDSLHAISNTFGEILSKYQREVTEHVGKLTEAVMNIGDSINGCRGDHCLLALEFKEVKQKVADMQNSLSAKKPAKIFPRGNYSPPRVGQVPSSACVFSNVGKSARQKTKLKEKLDRYGLVLSEEMEITSKGGLFGIRSTGKGAPLPRPAMKKLFGELAAAAHSSGESTRAGLASVATPDTLSTVFLNELACDEVLD